MVQYTNDRTVVRAQIFGTTFEITSRYVDLQPVGMGAFGLVWYVHILICHRKSSC